MYGKLDVCMAYVLELEYNLSGRQMGLLLGFGGGLITGILPYISSTYMYIDHLREVR